MSLAPHDFEACDKQILVFDGLDNDQAPGEAFATRYGVTEMTWRNAYEQGLVKSPDLSTGTREDFAAIRRAMYWNTCKCSSLPAGVNLMVYNDAILSGVGHSTRLLQRLVGVTPDGVIGPNTLAAVFAFKPDRLVDMLADADREFLASLANAPLYLKGWLRREDFMVQAAKAMIYG